MRIGVILGSVRTGRVGESVARWVMDAASNRTSRGDISYELIDLAEFSLPVLSSEVVPGAANRNYDNPAVTAWSQAIDACDAFVFVTPEYNHSVPGGFKNAFDSLAPEWVEKPVAFVGYGPEGASRAVEHWRQIVANFSMFGVRNQVALSFYDDFEDGTMALAPREIKAANLTRMLDDLEAQLA